MCTWQALAVLYFRNDLARYAFEIWKRYALIG